MALCAGHVVGDETIIEALIKEAQEEIGINLKNYDIKFLTKLKPTEPNNYCFSHHYYIFANIPIENFTIQEDELTEVLYVSFEKLKQMVISNDPEVVFKWNDNYKLIFKLLENIINN